MRYAPPFISFVVLTLVVVGCSQGTVKTEHTVIDGIPVKVTSGDGGKGPWTRFDVAQPVPVPRGGAIPAGSLMRRPGYPAPITDTKVRAFVLKKNTTFGDVSCRGFFEFDTYFDANLNLRVCPLNGDHLIDGVPCKGTSVSSWRETQRRSATNPAAVFHSNGRLQKCIASRAFERAGVSYEEWQVVRLTDVGAPEP